MSAETKAAMEDAIAAHVEDEHENGAVLVAGYVMMVKTQTVDQLDRGTSGYYPFWLENQGYESSFGLGSMLLIELERTLLNQWNAD